MSRVTPAEKAKRAAEQAERIAAHIRTVVDAAPPLTPQQLTKLSALLNPSGEASYTPPPPPRRPRPIRIQVRFPGPNTSHWAYVASGDLGLQVGDIVEVPVARLPHRPADITTEEACVVALSSDYAGECKEVIRVVRRAFDGVEANE